MNKIEKRKAIEEYRKDRIFEIEKKYKDDCLELDLEVKFRTEMEFQFNYIMYSSKSIGFFEKSNLSGRRGVTTKEHVREILRIFKPGDDKFVLRFAGKDPIETPSTFSFRFDNYTHIEEQYCKLRYTSDLGIEVAIEIPRTVLAAEKIIRQKNPNSKSKDPEMVSLHWLGPINPFGCQNYATGQDGMVHYVYTGEKQLFLDLFKED